MFRLSIITVFFTKHVCKHFHPKTNLVFKCEFKVLVLKREILRTPCKIYDMQQKELLKTFWRTISCWLKMYFSEWHVILPSTLSKLTVNSAATCLQRWFYQREALRHASFLLLFKVPYHTSSQQIKSFKKNK